MRIWGHGIKLKKQTGGHLNNKETKKQRKKLFFGLYGYGLYGL